MPRDFRQSIWDAATEAECRQIIRAAVLEDLDRGYDWTSAALVPAHAVGRAALVARAEGIIAGIPAVALVADEMDKVLAFVPRLKDGDTVKRGDTVATLAGPARSMLAAERLMLNLLGRLSGVATLTGRYVEQASGTKARIYDTRKTTPGWRRLEKYAVRQGGGHNHRMGLFDAILIKDNHIAFMAQSESAGSSSAEAAGSGKSHSVDAAAAATRRARAFLTEAFSRGTGAEMIVEVEVDSLDQLEGVLRERPDIVLVDNMTTDQLRHAVALRDSSAPDVELEASGGVTLATVAQIARTGIDRISVGALTHSAPVLDVALDWLT